MHVQRDRFYIRRSDNLATLDYKATSFESYYVGSWSRERAQAIIAEAREGMGPPAFTYGVVDKLEIVPWPICGVCGVPLYDLSARRCHKHLKRNACAIDGCSRSRTTESAPSDDDYLCGEHWKMFVPPRSPMRRVYNRLWRLSKKKGGWTPDLDRRFWTVWRSIIRRARQAHSGQFEGFVDEAEINRMFGWS